MEQLLFIAKAANKSCSVLFCCYIYSPAASVPIFASLLKFTLRHFAANPMICPISFYGFQSN